jgi:hypothetical protein
MVTIPEALALDLVHYLAGVGCIIHEMSREQCDGGQHEEFERKHHERMEAFEVLVNDRICVSGGKPDAKTVLATMAAIYEGAALAKPA